MNGMYLLYKYLLGLANSVWRILLFQNKKGIYVYLTGIPYPCGCHFYLIHLHPWQQNGKGGGNLNVGIEKNSKRPLHFKSKGSSDVKKKNIYN